ncbi:PsiF family protein [Hylemonella sp. W303a]|uniref:PsiF family protein n=1 Tax=Hylemonella sp. W303a TaxID=3389873 RepID=UPI00396B13F4
MSQQLHAKGLIMKSSSLKFAYLTLRLSLAFGLAMGLSYVWAAVPPQTSGSPASATVKPAKPAPVVQTQAGQESGKKQTQQERMKSCNAEAKAKTLKGDERKAFMSQCLSNKSEVQGAKK